MGARSYEKPATIDQLIWCHISEDLSIQNNTNTIVSTMLATAVVCKIQSSAVVGMSF